MVTTPVIKAACCGHRMLSIIVTVFHTHGLQVLVAIGFHFHIAACCANMTAPRDAIMLCNSEV